jgi:cephalosporin hydroxylase
VQLVLSEGVLGTGGWEIIDRDDFQEQRRRICRQLAESDSLRAMSLVFAQELGKAGYGYQFDWCGLPIIQVPQDIVAVQELIWSVRPAAIIETGVARGGSLALSASLLELLGGDRIIIGVDIEIRPANRAAIESHPLAGRIRLVEGSSVDPATVERVRDELSERVPVMVLLDSNHTHDHVLAELRYYSPFVKAGSYITVFDTIIEDLPADYFPGRPWGPGNSPKSAVRAFLQENDRFEIDSERDRKLVLSAAPDGFLRCIKD